MRARKCRAFGSDFIASVCLDEEKKHIPVFDSKRYKLIRHETVLMGKSNSGDC